QGSISSRKTSIGASLRIRNRTIGRPEAPHVARGSTKPTTIVNPRSHGDVIYRDSESRPHFVRITLLPPIGHRFTPASPSSSLCSSVAPPVAIRRSTPGTSSNGDHL